MLATSQLYELPSNDGRTCLVLALGRETVGEGGELLAGSLVLTRHHWDRVKLLERQYLHGHPDFRLELSQVLFRVEALQALATALLAWSDLAFSALVTTPLAVDLALCDADQQELWISFDKVHDYNRGDRAECRIRAVTCAESASCAFVVDVSGARRFGGELLAFFSP